MIVEVLAPVSDPQKFVRVIDQSRKYIIVSVDELKTFIHARPPKLRNLEEDIVLTQEQLDALQKEFDEYNRTHAIRSFDPIPFLPIDEEELQSAADAVLEEQLKLIEMLGSRIPEEENADEMRDV